ncbi:FAD-dependent oxidoreductase [Coraliomargarita sp. SDUM461004]|uniref:FAD-dependent oxidoreductase n=1 Tax=Thalassobacterium sedimentorum TaxID=3041258 RepID=A0ABU1AR83_9BACT|nr:FAD-dependent oxidoreductase [Coraliomargarita sp. SDUM461004]MDQ8196118.1 FAD-dependent oxidoreductase [Coraliomargarita sp. SDUM461004]
MSLNTLKTDTLVCGGGCAGLGAAISAARAGVDTLLVERAPFAGGIVTTVGLPYLDGIVDPKSGDIVVNGLAREILSRMDGCAPDASRYCEIAESHLEAGNQSAVLIPNTEQFKRVADSLLVECSDNLRILYNASVCDVDVREGRIEGLSVATKGGLYKINARTIIDTTGDGDVAYLAGSKMEKSNPLMPMTLHFRIGNVRPTPNMKQAMQRECEQAVQAGEIALFYGPHFEYHFADNEMDIHAIRVSGDASDPFELTQAEITGRRESWIMFERWKSNVPGFENAYFVSSGPYIGVRETRRLKGRYQLTEQDILANTTFDDAVAIGTWYLDVHPNSNSPGQFQSFNPKWPGPYHIPYRSLLPKEVSNLVVAGRCHSATAIAASSSRVTVTAMAMGEAAGAAAKLADLMKRDVAEIEGSSIRSYLADNGVELYPLN